MKLKKIIRNIFSVRNDGTDKLIMLFGIPIRIDRSKCYKQIVDNTPVENNKIIFSNFKGAGYGCNPKYILEEILRRRLNCNIVWLSNFPKNDKNIPNGINFVGYKTKKALKEHASAKIWIDNQRKNYYIKKGLIKKSSQYYLNTWHGSLGIKKVGPAHEKFDEKLDWVTYAMKDAQMLDYVLSNSNFENMVFQKNFWGYGKIIQTGHPRNDIFFKSPDELGAIKKKVFETLEIDTNKKMVLYAPSFREDKRLDCYDLDADNLLNNLNEKFGQDWVLVVRMHPHLKKHTKNLFDIGEKVINASYYPDIQELLASSDIAITDYSSCIFDFMLSRKPGFIFATDIEQFNTERGFYYPLESTPFPISRTNEELAKNIIDFDYEKYKNDVEQFLKDKGCMEDGHASERVVDLIEKIINQG